MATKLSTGGILRNGAILAALVSLSLTAPARAEKAAVAKNLKVGYFNLTLLKASYPESVGSETLRIQAEEQLRREVEEANKRLKKAADEKKSQEEVQKLVNEIQVALTAKRQALAQLLQTATTQANDKIFQTAAVVAKEQNLDLIVDGGAVYFGGQGLLENGQDVTVDMLKRLSPGFQISAKGETKTEQQATKASAQPPAKTQTK